MYIGAPVVNLIKNRIYPTYQLYARMANRKLTPEEGLKFGVLVVLSWLRARLGAAAPEELNFPGPDRYAEVSLEALPSLHINAGFVIDMISLPEKNLWSLQITEPDLGSNPGRADQPRQPVPGRIIETNVGFHVLGNDLEVGVQTVISDPETSAWADVYRPAFVKRLYDSPLFGLIHVIPITSAAYMLNTKEQLGAMVGLLHNQEHQLPCIVFTPARKVTYEDVNRHRLSPEQLANAASKGKLEKNFVSTNFSDKRFGGPKMAEVLSGPLAKRKQETIDLATVVPAKVEYFLPFDADKLAASLAAYGRVYRAHENMLPSLREYAPDLEYGDILIFEPGCYGGKIAVVPLGEPDGTYRELRQRMMNYCRGKVVDFGEIYFLGGARDMFMEHTSALRQASREQGKQWEVERSIIEKRWQGVLDEKINEMERLQKEMGKLQQALGTKEQVIGDNRREFEMELAGMQNRLAEREAYIAYLEGRLGRPRAKKDIPGWIKQKFAGRLQLHTRAIQALDSANVNPDRLELLYDALESLATDYWDYRFGGITEEEMNRRMGLKYKRGFVVTQVGDTTIEFKDEQYILPYLAAGVKKPVNRRMDYHLKVGNKTEHLIRIYFFHDEERKLIVVGYLPDHLDCVKC